MSQQVLKPKIKYIPYFINGDSHKLKVKVYGKIRKDIIAVIGNSIHFLPDDFKSYLGLIKSFEIRKCPRNYSTVGVFNNDNYSLKIYDHPAQNESDYSEAFLHEFAHLIFHQYILVAEYMVEKGNENPLDEFIQGINEEKIKPITHYLNDLESDKNFKLKYDYPNELFAGYFAFTYSRYTDPSQVKGSFCNYIKLRNLFWLLVDEIELTDVTDEIEK